jgi:hypothetical protein
VALEMPPSVYPAQTNYPLPINIGKHNNHPTAASSLTNGSYATDDGRDDEVMMMDNNGIVYKQIPTPLPHSVTTRTMQPPPQYLEMEASTGGGISYGEIMDYNNSSEQQQQYYLNQPNADHIQPDPGCFCLGYNMLDYIISAAPLTQQKQRPSLVLNGKKQRLSGVLRPVRLPRVNESATMMEQGSRPFDSADDHDNLSEVIDTTVELSSSLSAIKKMKSLEPE